MYDIVPRVEMGVPIQPRPQKMKLYVHPAWVLREPEEVGAL